MVQKKNCGDAKSTGWKSSDKKDLGAEVRIIAALKSKQPLTAEEMCNLAKINLSTFYRNFRVLEKQ